MCVLGFNFVTFFWEKCNKNIHEWQIVKPIKIRNSKSYIGPWCWFWYTLYISHLSICVPSFNVTAFIVPEKSVMKNFSLMVNYKTYHVTPRVMGLCPGFLYTPYINPLGMCVPSYNFVTLQFLRNTKIYLIRMRRMIDRRKEWGKEWWKEGMTEGQSKSSIAPLSESGAIII